MSNANEYFSKASNGQKISFEHKIQQKYVGEVWLEIEYIPLIGNENNITGIALTVQDITLRKKAKAKILAQKNQLEEKFLTKIDTAFPWIKIIIDTENSKDFRESIEIISPYKNIGVRIIEGNFWGNKGANAVQSLAFGLSAWVESLDIFTEKNNSEKKISNCQIGININENYFMEMAKIRALRILTTKILETYHSKIDINILSLTQKQNLTNIDEYNNLLRLTTEAM
ncbi:MAG: hypothetical protein EAZ73_29930, partial [Oscillatoriales cyanobacterium]